MANVVMNSKKQIVEEYRKGEGTYELWYTKRNSN